MLRVLEIFSGIGSPRSALTNVGIEHTSTCIEMDPHAHASYEAIHGPTPNLGDICKVESVEKFDLWVYGFPCQDLSVAGHRKGMEEGSGTRSSLLWEVARLLRDAVEREREPEVLVMENVPAILQEANLPAFQRWLATLSDLGYTNSYALMDAAQYGVPQHRVRCICVSMKGGRMFEFPAPCPDGRVLKDVLEWEPSKKYYFTREKIANYERHRIRHEQQGHGLGWRPSEPVGYAHPLTCNPTRHSQNFVIESGSLERYTFEMMNRVYSSDGLAPTLQTCQGGGRVPRIEEVRIRYLTPLEFWRLMGFDDADFEKAKAIGTSETLLYKQAGNSICVPVLEAVFRGIYLEKSWHIQPTLETWGVTA